MKNNITLSGLTKPLSQFLRRFHTLLFFLLVSGGLFVAILALMSIIETSSKVASNSDNAISGQFDQTTIQQLKQKSTPATPQGDRSNPFAE